VQRGEEDVAGDGLEDALRRDASESRDTQPPDGAVVSAAREVEPPERHEPVGDAREAAEAGPLDESRREDERREDAPRGRRGHREEAPPRRALDAGVEHPESSRVEAEVPPGNVDEGEGDGAPRFAGRESLRREDEGLREAPEPEEVQVRGEEGGEEGREFKRSCRQ
jgi:hypothetical protein